MKKAEEEEEKEKKRKTNELARSRALARTNGFSVSVCRLTRVENERMSELRQSPERVIGFRCRVAG